MNVSGLIEFFDGKIDGSLMDAVSSNDGDGLAEREEARVCRFPEAKKDCIEIGTGTFG